MSDELIVRVIGLARWARDAGDTYGDACVYAIRPSVAALQLLFNVISLLISFFVSPWLSLVLSSAIKIEIDCSCCPGDGIYVSREETPHYCLME